MTRQKANVTADVHTLEEHLRTSRFARSTYCKSCVENYIHRSLPLSPTTVRTVQYENPSLPYFFTHKT
jgi:hypothetical protein